MFGRAKAKLSADSQQALTRWAALAAGSILVLFIFLSADSQLALTRWAALAAGALPLSLPPLFLYLFFDFGTFDLNWKYTIAPFFHSEMHHFALLE